MQLKLFDEHAVCNQNHVQKVGRHDMGSKHSRHRRRRHDSYGYISGKVTKALVQATLESSNLIGGIDFTKTNEWTGSRSFHLKSLHHLGDSLNPYEHAISIIERKLSDFGEDNIIPFFGFDDE
ncbi:hypothetical protein SADUNF_Sadunf16G0007100 [Salix dunnii]|uniref:Uncharacterized protein n=1 Tax=Salix dunnii TaxID=1413687 RepID=A0A835J960_9ROSI|nr:hypothetical protein SADUNF_Sadunf16G0007100 [Salix dunnii]